MHYNVFWYKFVKCFRISLSIQVQLATSRVPENSSNADELIALALDIKQNSESAEQEVAGTTEENL
jgi:hypothetical protein